jgi:hypothetical protein
MNEPEPLADHLRRLAQAEPDADTRTGLYLAWLGFVGLHEPRVIGPGRWAAVRDLLFTAAIVDGPLMDFTGIDRHWCYRDRPAALAALAAWETAGTPEPTGWHRDPITGRRRVDGDPALEYRDGELAPAPWSE